MKALTLAASLALALAGCGVDGPPMRPQAAAPGISVTGETSIGMRTDDL